MKLKKLTPKTLFIYKSSKTVKRSGETDPTTTTITIATTGTGVFGI